MFMGTSKTKPAKTRMLIALKIRSGVDNFVHKQAIHS
jgi:hypothetical protein